MGFAHRSLDDFHEYQDMSEYKNVLRGSIFTAMDQVEGCSAFLGKFIKGIGNFFETLAVGSVPVTDHS